jgi:hypothetical protein
MKTIFGGCSVRPRLSHLCGLLLIAATCAPQQSAFAAESVSVPRAGAPITIHIDQAEVLKLPERTATLVVGNPLIADASVQPGGIMVITAKSYGETNFIALDRTGAVLAGHEIRVLGPADNVVVLYRGIERESYSCLPTCERRITLGDTQNYFNMVLNQTGSRNTQALNAQQNQQR